MSAVRFGLRFAWRSLGATCDKILARVSLNMWVALVGSVLYGGFGPFVGDICMVWLSVIALVGVCVGNAHVAGSERV